MDESGSAFLDVPRNPRGHLGLLFHAAAYHVLYFLRRRAAASGGTLEQVLREHPFLESFFATVRERLPRDIDWVQSIEWLRREVKLWEDAADPSLPIRRMRRALGIPYSAELVFVLAGMVEEFSPLAALFSASGHARGEHRASVGLMEEIFEPAAGEEPWSLIGPFVDSGFLHVVDPDVPRSEWILRVPPPLWKAARGEFPEAPLPGTRLYLAGSLQSAHELVADDDVRSQLLELGHLAASGRTRSVVLRGMPGTDRIGAAGAFARELGLGVLEIECATTSAAQDERRRLIGPLCTLSNCMPAFLVDPGPGETFEIPPLPGWSGPTAVLIGREGGIGGAEAARAITVYLDLESPSNRVELWRRALNGRASAEIAGLAAEFCLPGRYIAQCARLAIDLAAVDRRNSVSLDDVKSAARATNRQVLDTLAVRIDGSAYWTHLVLRESTFRELRVLEGRCRHRERLASAFHASVPGGMNRGVRALFEGPSGTGKTIAARVLANELGLDLYRVDLAAVVNKYIGETEKNLSKVLSRAEDLNVILLLDEGDSLMTRRTDVKSSNDRYANLETNYLLQRLESYTGIVIVTTNAGQSIDSAFRRRMDSVIKFHLPDAAERFQLWQVHLPQGHEVPIAVLEDAAIRHQFTGGQIRNISVRAALLSFARSAAALDEEDLREAIRAEHRKAGASFVEAPPPRAPRNGGAIAGFVGGLS
ncbi:MAG TPA: ATP-binding protein [Bryobacteraceae bacterium]|nr:ATP-binding protein [Bryobacteraceae bacterium]